jgi:hypothetical protein
MAVKKIGMRTGKTGKHPTKKEWMKAVKLGVSMLQGGSKADMRSPAGAHHPSNKGCRP